MQQVLGGTVAWHVEYDAAPARILAHHWPAVPNYHDVTTVKWDEVEPVDILTGGYPCQPFSQAGRRKGTNDERHLWPYVREAIRALRPRYTVLENVAGHRSLGFDRVLGDLAEDGFNVRWTSLRASDIGAPHHRERLFILVSDAAQQWWLVVNRDDVQARGGAGRHGPPAGRGGPADADGIGRGPRAEQSVAVAPQEPATLGDQRALPGGRRADAVLAGALGAYLPTPKASDGIRGTCPSERRRKSPNLETTVLPTPNASDSSGGGMHPSTRVGHSKQLIDHALEAGTPAWGKYAAAIHRWEQVTGPAPALTEPNRNGKQRLNAAFAEWMMGLPAGHVTGVPGVTRVQQLKAIGNGVCPPQAVAALHELFEMEAA